MIRLTCAILTLASDAMAATPSTRPSPPLPPVAPLVRPAMINTRRPAVVPQFAKADPTPAGHFAERDYVYRYTYPGSLSYGWGYYGYVGVAPGTWGGTQILFR